MKNRRDAMQNRLYARIEFLRAKRRALCIPQMSLRSASAKYFDVIGRVPAEDLNTHSFIFGRRIVAETAAARIPRKAVTSTTSRRLIEF